MWLCHCNSPVRMVGQQLFGMVCPQLIFPSPSPPDVCLLWITQQMCCSLTQETTKNYVCLTLPASHLFAQFCSGLSRAAASKNHVSWKSVVRGRLEVPCDGELVSLPTPCLQADVPGCFAEVTLNHPQGLLSFSSGVVLESPEGKRRWEDSLERADINMGKGMGENGAFSSEAVSWLATVV